MLIGSASIERVRCQLAVMDFAFMGGSMGSVVGEKFVRACESAAEKGVPLVSVTSSGGARMQEGILSLMQLPKTVCAVEDLKDAGARVIVGSSDDGRRLASFASPARDHRGAGSLALFHRSAVVQQTTKENCRDFGLAESNVRFGHLTHRRTPDLLRLGPRPATLCQNAVAKSSPEWRLGRLKSLASSWHEHLGELERLSGARTGRSHRE